MSIFHKQPVVRMAPSPTGHLHIGTARTALFNYLFAQKYDGKFIMRIEDTDKERSDVKYEKEIIEGLEWLGLTWDETYKQSERKDIYKEYLEKTIEKGKAFISEEDSKANPGQTVKVVRLKNPNKSITFEDEVRGEITFDTTELGDFVIARSIDDALYHFTVVVDDFLMDVTHVIRGEDHISNTPRQILIQEAIGAKRPIYIHLPLILAPDKSKLSKRHGAVMLKEYEEQGFLPHAIMNYLMLLGWNPGTDKELFSLKEVIEFFDISGIQKGGAVFDIEKLKWFNKEHLKALSDDEFTEYIKPSLEPIFSSKEQYSTDRFKKLIPTIRERTSTLHDVVSESENGEYDFAFMRPVVEGDLLKWKKDESVKDALPRLQKLAEIVASVPEESSVEEIKNFIWDYASEIGKGEVLWPLRVALTGKRQSPDPFTVIHIIGSGESYKRINAACDTILSSG